jgi:hypothetical protein
MRDSPSADKTPLVIYLLVIALPFLMFYWMIPFVTDLTLGRDYQEYAIQNQMELLFSIRSGSFPLYVPGYALGHSSSALTLGQMYHPISHIASILPGYWDGKALQWNTFLRLLLLGFTHLALFSFLKKIRLNIIFSFLLSSIAVYNLRMLDLFRFGASLEAYTGFLLLCTAIGLYLIKPSKLIGPMSITGTTYLLVCNGHPNHMFYGLIGTGLFLFVAPFFISDILQRGRISLKNVFMSYGKIGLFITPGILLSSAFIFPFYFDFLSLNTLRVAQSYNPLTVETLYGTVSNFFVPFFSDVHYAFGGSSLYLVAAILPVLRFFKVKVPFSVWTIWGFLLIAFLYMQGPRTPVHKWAWDYLPFFSSLRGEGRISIFMPFFLMLLLAWIVKGEPLSMRLRGRFIELTPSMLLAIISLLLISLYALLSFLMKMELGHFTPYYIRGIPLRIIVLFSFFGAVPLILLFLYGAYPQTSKMFGFLLVMATCIYLGGILQYGSFVSERHDQPTFEQMRSRKKVKLDYLYNPGAGMYSSVIVNHLNRSFLEPFLGKIYFQIMPVSSQEDAYERMGRKRSPRQLFVEGYPPEKTQFSSEEDLAGEEGKVNLIYSSFNRLEFIATSSSPAFFGMSYPYTGHWRAWVNGNKVPVYRANGAAHAVEIPEGESRIEFRYWSPAAFWGIIISCLTFTLIGFYVCFIALSGLPRAITTVIFLIIGICAAFAWYQSLYTGDNLSTEYVWNSSPPKPSPNLAYGKKSTAFPVNTKAIYFASNFYRTHWSKAVDGNISPYSGYIMNLDQNPTVIINLNQKEKINSIIIYESIKDPSENSRRLDLSLSNDKERWNSVGHVISEVKNNGPVHINFDSAYTARYIQIKGSGKGELFLDEVEIYQHISD